MPEKKSYTDAIVPCTYEKENEYIERPTYGEKRENAENVWEDRQQRESLMNNMTWKKT